MASIHIRQNGAINIQRVQDSDGFLTLVNSDLNVRRGEIYPITNIVGSDIVFPDGVAVKPDPSLYEVIEKFEGEMSKAGCCGG